MIYFLIPVYNEEDNIINLQKELELALPGENKLFVFSDDGSVDDSMQLIKKNFKAQEYIILGDGINRGPGCAFNVGFEWILENSKNDDDIIITLEADCTSDISILNDMVVINRLGYDLVLASVYAQGGGFEETSIFRKLLSSIANILFRLLFDLKVLTLSSFYRVYSKELLLEIKKNEKVLITEHGFICMLEILIKAIQQNAKIIEVPMMLRTSKRVGSSKMKIMKTTLAYFKFLLRNKK